MDENPTEGQRAAFEAGIKFGSLYHQFAGTPVSPESSGSLARAMEDAIENQPYCESVAVTIRTERIAEDAEHGYVELTGKYLEVDLEIEREGRLVTASMEMTDGYPLMTLDSVRAGKSG